MGMAMTMETNMDMGMVMNIDFRKQKTYMEKRANSSLEARIIERSSIDITTIWVSRTKG